MPFLFNGYFPACPFKVDDPGESLSPLYLKDAMAIWWKTNKLTYSWDWSYSGGTVTVTGSGSVLMDGEYPNMSDKICPENLYFTCKQKVHYQDNTEGIDEDVEDSVYFIISPYFYYYFNEDLQENLYFPQVSLTIVPQHSYYDSWSSVHYPQEGNGGFLSCFGLTLPVITMPNYYYGVNVSIDLAEESKPQ